MKTREEWFKDIVAKYDRIAIAGGPRAGKTTLADTAPEGMRVIHGDAFKNLEWSAASQALCDEVNATGGRLVVEGVAVPRALRKGMQVDVVVWIDNPCELRDGLPVYFSMDGAELAKGQESMRKGTVTIFADWFSKQGGEDGPIKIMKAV